jgi:hypothetical protein
MSASKNRKDRSDSQDSPFSGIFGDHQKAKKSEPELKSEPKTRSKPSLNKTEGVSGKFLYLSDQQMANVDVEIAILKARKGININRSILVSELLNMWLSIQSGKNSNQALQDMLARLESYTSK